MGTGREIEYAYKTRPSSFINTLFMSTVNTAAKTLVSVATNITPDQPYKWRPSDHLRFLFMMMTWTTVWALRILMDHFPVPAISFSASRYLLGGFSSFKKYLLPPPSSSSSYSDSTSRALTLLCNSSGGESSMALIQLQEGFDGLPSVKQLRRTLTHVFALLNEIPANSSKYQFAMAMAERIMDGNARYDHSELVEVNRVALSSAFARTLNLLQRSLQRPLGQHNSLTFRVIRALPLGSYLASYVKGLNYCLNTMLGLVGKGASRLERKLLTTGSVCSEYGGGGGGDGADYVLAEKLSQELLWITHKLRIYGAVEEALVQWSFASKLASLALTTNPRVQGTILKISAILIGDLPGEKVEVSTQVKFNLIGLWLPLFCHAYNGLSYPILSSFEKIEVERAINQVIGSLPSIDQEILFTNWLQDFAVTSSEWPNLQASYDRWCQSTRELVD